MAKRFGLTGGIGSGKSVCSRYLATCGITIVDADLLTPLAYERAHDDLLDTFGAQIFDVSGCVDKKRLGSIVFSDKAQLDQLNAIMYPVMTSLAEEHLSKAENIAVLDAALLFEANWNVLVDQTVVVVASLEDRIQRIIDRNHTTRELAMARIQSQFTDAERIRLSDHIIYNMRDVQCLKRQCDCVFCKT